MSRISSRSRLAFTASAVLFALVAASCGSSAGTVADVVGPGAVAEVGGETLSQSDLEELSLQGDQADPALTLDRSAAAQTIGQWIRTELWIAEMANRDFPLTDDHIAAARVEVEEIARLDPSVPDLDSRIGTIILRSQALSYLVADYLTNVEGVVPVLPRQLCSSHILLDTEAEAVAAIERLEAGEDFAALAAELSTGPSGPSGGDLGCVDPASFVAEFVAGAEEVDAPGISEPVQSEFGWHVINVHSFDEGEPVIGAEYNQAVFNSSGEIILELQEVAMAGNVSLGSRYGEWNSETLLVETAG